MKELTIEEKAKRYDKALERAKKWRNAPNVGKIPTFANRVVEEIFPELKESEDEQSRKWILEYLYDGLRRSDEQFKGQFKCAIAWLEKQEEFKSSRWTEGDVVRHGGVLALVTNGRKAMKSNCEQITIQYPDEWVKTGTKERKYFFEELEKQGKKKSIDYTHTNVFTEKAAIWFNNNFIVHDEYGVISDSFDTKEEMFEDFKNYMKEE